MEAAGTKHLSFRGRSADAFAEPERFTVAEAFARFAGIDLLATLPGGKADRGALARAAKAAGIRIGDDDSWGDIFSSVLVEKVEGHLGLGRLTIVDQYPAARRRWHGKRRPIGASPSVSSFMPAASSSPTGLAK